MNMSKEKLMRLAGRALKRTESYQWNRGLDVPDEENYKIDYLLVKGSKASPEDVIAYHQSFFYVMGIAPETRANIRQMFDFKQDCIKPEGMHGGWQTSGTVRVCRLAFNLWNGYTEPEHSNAYSPEDLFCCEFAPYFMEGMKIRYPEYCRELPPARKQAEPAR